MKYLTARNLWASLASVGIALSLSAISAEAYTGGPVRAHVAGVDPGTSRVYYYHTFHDESGAGPEFWFFDLNSENPEQAQRAPSLDYVGHDFWSEGHSISDAWQSLSSHITPLASFRDFDLRVRLAADSVGVDPEWNVPVYQGHLEIEEPRFGAVRDLTVLCEPMIVVRGLYQIPGRSEAVIVVSYKGRAYGCEETEEPILLTAARARPDTGGFDRENRGTATGSPEPFSFDGKGSHGYTAGQFVACLAEIGAPERPVFWYLSLDYACTARPTEMWLVSLNSSSPKQPIRYNPPGADSLHDGWGAWRTLSRLKGRRVELGPIQDVDVALRLKTESAGLDSASAAPRYSCALSAETCSGAGAVRLTAVGSTIMQVRGVYPLPAGAELIVVTYTGTAGSQSQEDVPIVLYPK